MARTCEKWRAHRANLVATSFLRAATLLRVMDLVEELIWMYADCRHVTKELGRSAYVIRAQHLEWCVSTMLPITPENTAAVHCAVASSDRSLIAQIVSEYRYHQEQMQEAMKYLGTDGLRMRGQHLRRLGPSSRVCSSSSCRAKTNTKTRK